MNSLRPHEAEVGLADCLTHVLDSFRTIRLECVDLLCNFPVRLGDRLRCLAMGMMQDKATSSCNSSKESS